MKYVIPSIYTKVATVSRLGFTGASSTFSANCFSSFADPYVYPKSKTNPLSRQAFTKQFVSTVDCKKSGSEIVSNFVNSKDWEGQNIAAAVEALAYADAVCFDVDSTVIQEEGIDVLAGSLGKGEEVSSWTKKAMDGNTKFEDALAARLEIIQPSRASIEKCLIEHPLKLSPGIDRLVDALSACGKDVFLISGGFRIMIEPIAKELNISETKIIANTIFFDENTTTGEYVGFDRTELTSADMGKPKAIQSIKDKGGYKTVVMVGDGATDAQSKPPADAFIGFGGVVVREAVQKKACWFVRDFDDMIDIVLKYGKK